MPNDRLLVCDDHQDSLEVLTLFLGKAGFDVVSTGTGREAIHLARKQKFNAYMLDSWLPDISGTGLCGAIREFDSITPIIIYSASALPGEIEAIPSQGAQAYIVKPASAEEILDTLSKILQTNQYSQGPGASATSCQTT